MKKILYVTVIFAAILFFAGADHGLQAKKFKFTHSFSKGGDLKVISQFVTYDNNANNAKPANEFCIGNTVYFYYKVGPVQSVAGKGMPFRTRMVVELTSRNGKKQQDLGWQKGNGVSGNMINKTQNFGYYHSARWNLKLATSIEPGSDYKVTIYHNDLNSGKTVKMVYNIRNNVCH